MDYNWYLSINGQTYGPYDLIAIRKMLDENEIHPDTFVYHSSLSSWLPASRVADLQKYKRKKRPIFKIALSLLLVVVLIISTLVVLDITKERMLELGKRDKIGTYKIDESGGKLNADGFEIEIPEGAFSKNINFSVYEREIQSHLFGENFNPASPLYQIENGNIVSDEPMTVTIPISIREDEFAMAFYYTEDGELEAMPLLYQDQTKIITVTTHFSNIITSRIKINSLFDIAIDSGFVPGVDDWSFTNYGSQHSSGGFCAGQTVSMAYYFYELKAEKGQGLFTKYDNNTYRLKTPEFPWDDSLGIRLASVVQESAAWNSYYYHFIRDYIHKGQYLSDRNLYMSFAYALLLTGDPQLMAIFVRNENPDNKITLTSGHAILVYKVDKNKIYVADPNFPGNNNLSIPFDGTSLGNYVSKTQVGKPDILYNSFSIIGKSAIFNWKNIGNLFREMDKHTQDSSIGNIGFGYSDFYVVTDYDKDKDKIIEVDNPKEIVYDEAAKNRIREYYKNDVSAPLDIEDKDYLVLTFSVGAKNDGYLVVYNGTSYIAEGISDGPELSTVFIPIESGTNDIGLGFFDQNTTFTSTDVITDNSFIHFHRVKVENGEEDFTGNWEGDYKITEAENFIRLARKVGTVLYKAIHSLFGSIFNSDDELPPDKEIEDMIEESIRGDADFFASNPIKVRMSRIDKENYDVWVNISGDDEDQIEHHLQAKYKNGKLEFTIPFNERLTAKFVYELHDNKTFTGEFQAKFGIIKLASGETTLKKSEVIN